MKSLLKRYWWLLLLTIVVMIFKFLPHKLPFLEKIEKAGYESGDASAYDPLKRISQLNIEDVSLKGFIPVVQVKNHVTSFKEIPLAEGDAYEPRVSLAAARTAER
ncbi:MAG: hypothetical protein A2X56_03540 [Nitrospirae bacterium GWC2_57_13]|jgi:hypothetical protein|nr:MAG: hypothetical protein A2072_03065 [Nitrospirae bacterium GWC1_57_7]OGW28298.1 MAG: hypothetical protein A2X56_03540 [Nitrospirae bacterium GWC2_57_13]OGW40629.1 MAG: hypothetical protein A2X57_03445 [Nitrospirae bacterium GWD2_57_8]HAR46232.1 hypothetical protein [Nitrospiraceae bacterium]HAS54914.1 hypothetical protein [Nitrospiraceae bacterium]